MNFICFIIILSGLGVAICEALFLAKTKSEPILFCIKVCPLYCHPNRRKRDVEMHMTTPLAQPEPYYFEDEDSPWQEFPEDIYWPKYYRPYYFCKPQPTTTQTPPTSTEEPTFICQLCKDKCNYPPSPTTTSTTTPSTTTHHYIWRR